MAKGGRPSKYTEALAEEICRRIAHGEPLTKISSEEAMPDYSTVLRWRVGNEEFCVMYARAREDAADTLADQILEIADDSGADWTQTTGAIVSSTTSTSSEPGYASTLESGQPAR